MYGHAFDLYGFSSTTHPRTCLGFVDMPTSLNVTVEVEISFTCQHFSTNALQWTINGTLLDVSHPPNITETSQRLSNGEIVSTLHIRAFSSYNGTVVRCLAYVEIQPDETPPAVLLIQGTH